MEPKPEFTNLNLKSYDATNWAAKVNPSASAVRQLRNAMKKDINALKQEIKTALSDKAKFKDAGSDLAVLYNKFKSNDPTLKKELEDIKHIVVPENVPSSIAGLSYEDKQMLEKRVYQAETQLFKQKTGSLPSSENLEIIAAKIGAFDPTTRKWASGMNHTKIREMVLLDDPPNWLLEAIQSNKNDDFFSGAYTEHRFKPQADTTTRISTMINDSANAVDVKIKPTRFLPDAVDIPSIATVLNPENSKTVARFSDALPASVSTYFVEIPVVPSTTTGNFFFMINPRVNNNQDFSSFIAYSNAGSAYVAQTGAFATYNTLFNPLLNLTSSIQSSRIVGLSVVITPTVTTSTNLTNGQFEVWHDPTMVALDSEWISGASGSWTSPFLTNINIGNKPFYQRGPVVQNYSQLFYNTLSNTPYTDVHSTATLNSAPIVVLLTGGNNSGQQIANITVQIVFNNVPTPLGLATQPMTSPGLGPYTSSYLEALASYCPRIYTLGVSERMAFLSECYASDGTYSSLMEIAHKFMKK